MEDRLSAAVARSLPRLSESALGVFQKADSAGFGERVISAMRRDKLTGSNPAEWNEIGWPGFPRPAVA